MLQSYHFDMKQSTYRTILCIVRILLIVAAFALGYQYAKYTTFGIAEGYYHITQKAITAI